MCAFGVDEGLFLYIVTYKINLKQNIQCVREDMVIILECSAHGLRQFKYKFFKQKILIDERKYIDFTAPTSH